MTTTRIIVCRARVARDCYDGRPERTAEPMHEAGTYNGNSIVCDACYVMLMPLTPSGQGLSHELPEAIALARRGNGR